MIVGVNPKVDYAFKWLFGNEKHPQFLIRILNATLDLHPGEQIVEITILNPFTDKMSVDEKLAILDIKVRDQLGRYYNVEMQMVVAAGLRQRILYYWAKLYSSQLHAGDNYPLLKPTISVCFVDGVLFPKTTDYHSTFQLLDSAGGAALTDDLAIHFFELSKFELSAEELTTPLEVWLYFLRHGERLDPAHLPRSMDTADFREVVEELMTLTEIDIQREIYEGREKARRDALNLINTAAQAEAERERAEAERDQAVAERDRAEARAAGAEARLQEALDQAEARLQEAVAEALRAAAESSREAK